MIELTYSTKRVLKQLTYLTTNHFSHFEWFYQSHQQLARFLDMSISTVRRSIETLISQKILDVDHRKGTSNMYRLNLERLDELLTEEPTPSNEKRVSSLIEVFRNTIVKREDKSFLDNFVKYGIKHEPIFKRFVSFTVGYKKWLQGVISDNDLESFLVGLIVYRNKVGVIQRNTLFVCRADSCV
ncbi:hypothetical protein [Aliivibrio sp. EL58]|uniref:hypothetical protein n=1 Tax=Aliivibrio sp. EL58 TaxID=2107582 RepID=UPI001572E6ED|nr:hypothetical protein [Aliivibrio sp. EL58]